ncbi:MAG: Smr/MutS family protein, partial [Brevundimonas sp.]|nr:Smr/MutS family protein [Brevundimonas sp.]
GGGGGAVTPSKPITPARVTPGAAVGDPPPAPLPKGPAKARGGVIPNTPLPTVPARPRGHPEALEPRRQRRLSRERDPIEARIDLHGYGGFQAQDALTAFLIGAQARGYRSVLVITGQGRRGGSGVIRASVHEWLQGPALRGVVSGFAAAARHHGGDGALYVTIRRG